MPNNQTHQTPAKGPVDEFVAWIEKQAQTLDRKVEETSAQAEAMRAEMSQEARKNWREARDAVDHHRRELNRQMELQKTAAESELKDIQAATKRSLNDLGDKVDEFRREVAKAVRPH